MLVLSDAGVDERRMRVAVGDGGTIAGFATYLIANDLAELEDLFVDRDGCGRAAVRRWCSTCRRSWMPFTSKDRK
jgi:hypothetical protein